MSDGVVLGVHSHVYPGTRGSVERLIDGHAWISVTRDGRTDYYGLWPDTHPDVRNNGQGTDIRSNLEAGQTATANRYFTLDANQVKRLETALQENVQWRYTYTCASWASDTVHGVTGHRIDANDVLGFETPRKLAESIQALERRQPTSPTAPLPIADKPRSSSFPAAASLTDDPLRLLAELIDDPQRRRDWEARVAGHLQELDAAAKPMNSFQEPATRPLLPER